jgi:hypothetical protein
MIRTTLATLISLLSGNTEARKPPADEVEPLYRSYAFPTVPSSTDKLFDEADRRTEKEKPLRLLDLPVL